jgi:hypothetical protein
VAATRRIAQPCRAKAIARAAEAAQVSPRGDAAHESAAIFLEQIGTMRGLSHCALGREQPIVSRMSAAGSGGAMQTYDTLVELARICLKQAREAKDPLVSTELTHLAKGYQMRAASMNNGKLPDIGEEGPAS